MNFLWYLHSLIREMVQGNLEKALAAVEFMMTLLEVFQIPESSEEFDSKLEQTCDWRKDLSETVRMKAEVDKSLIARGREALFEANSPIQRWYLIMFQIGYDNAHGNSFLANTIVQFLAKASLSKNSRTSFSLSKKQLKE